ncbi:MAG: chromosome partition protein MukB [Deferrisomatales bacterium]|nr:chromosome partition protein MukB [Deferrisomatales bacterium]
MKRTRAQALALVNWKGVFYERYLLDDHVTALEGANGAGKTTVMIAAYVVLLPDMTRLRFTNLGESAATGGDKGIYGRLGDPDSPSYAAIDFRLGSGERLLAGVLLERRSEPTVELTPFVASGLREDAALQDVLLDRGELDAVPDLNRLRELVALGGGRLHTFSKAGDYFADLFDRGVTPLRLTGDEERTKLNEMLRTSMVGGISRALTGGLREFLLKAETGLADTLKRMRGNLDACRRTRIEVETAQRMEQEIHGVYEAGQEMFVAAVHATRERAEELHQRLQRAQAGLELGEREERALAASLEEKTGEHEAARRELSSVHDELEQARELLARIRAANEIARRIKRREDERVDLAASETQKRSVREKRHEGRERARKRRAGAQEQVKVASHGLADFQEGLDELHRRAAAFEQVSRRLADARAGLPEHDVGPGNVSEVRAICEQRIGGQDAAIVRLDRDLATVRQRRAEHERVTAALVHLTGDTVDADSALQVARQALRELRGLESLVAELPELPARLDRARELAEHQHRVRETARGLEAPDQPLATAQAVREAFAAADAALEAVRRELSDSRARIEETAAERKQGEKEIADLESLLPRWRDARDRAQALEASWEQPLKGEADIETLQSVLLEKRDSLNGHIDKVQTRVRDLVEMADQLEHSGGQFSTELLRARDAVEGELLAGHFDDVPVEEAGRLQAVLGPFAEAIVVDDVVQAARRLAGEAVRPDTVWLVDESTTLVSDPAEAGAEHVDENVLVAAPSGSRLTRIPERPTLGRRARTQRVREVRAEVERLESEITSVRADERRVGEALASARKLLAESSLLTREDPQPELTEARKRVAAAIRRDRDLSGRAEMLRARAGKLTTRRESLGNLLADSHLLDLQDQDDVVRALGSRLSEARAAKERLERAAPHIATVEDGFDILRAPPPTDDELRRIRADLDAARERRDRLSGPLDSLRYVEDHLPELGWSDAPAALAEKQTLRPALEEQVRAAEADLGRAEEGERAAETALEDAVVAAQKAQAALDQLDAALDLDRKQLAESGIAHASDEAVATAEHHHRALRDCASGLDERERTLASEVAEAKVRHEQQAEDVIKLRAVREDEEAQWRPVADRWQRLQTEAAEAGVLHSAMTPEIIARTRSAGSVNLYQEARSRGDVLAERLAHSEGGGEHAETINSWLAQASQDFGLAYLRAWLDARDWLRRRVPPQIAEVDDPLETLARVREHLGRLQERLAQQEKNLRGQSEDVARNIETQRRKARREVGRLNNELEIVGFGSIHGVRIQVRPVESRERVLRALREGEAQQLLFQSEMPIEEAMDELFKRYGGGQTGGQRLLDYREYLDLQVEVRRQASPDWELANPTRMSTGEAIGVGAAIMMVVLTAWERHANLLRAKRSAGTLRLLFLDEANRLSQDNLGVLFELCQGLELQLLIAAPEVAQAEGNTTYHLVRQIDDDGREVVRVAGRRTPQGDA